jgi:hypothetical protein
MGKRRRVNVSVNPGEPTDGTGKVCIHLFVQDERGPFVEPCVLHPMVENGEVVNGKVVSRPTRGRLACDPKRGVAPVVKNGVTTITMRTDSPEAVTCPKCRASRDYADMMKEGK